MALDNGGAAASAHTLLDGESCQDEATSLEGVHVLVVDDDPDMQCLLSLVLSQAGATVLPLGSAAAAIEAFGHHRPNLVVSDLELPGIDGIELIRLIRSVPRTDGGRTPAILLTGDTTTRTRSSALSAGFDAFLCKPVAPRDLLATAASVLRDRARVANRQVP